MLAISRIHYLGNGVEMLVSIVLIVQANGDLTGGLGARTASEEENRENTLCLLWTDMCMSPE